jgi:hypothetical protein
MSEQQPPTRVRDAAELTDGSALPRRGVSARVIVLSLALIPANVFFIHGFCWLRYDVTGWDSVLENAVAGIFALSLGNLALKRWRPRWAFSVGEMITLYVLVAISTSFVAMVWSIGTTLAGTISYPFWFAGPENHWDELLWPYLPQWLTVSDRAIIEGYYVGNSSLYSLPVVRAWVGPALRWTSFAAALFWVTLCINSIVRRRWEEEEKLPFPLVAVPVHVVDERFQLLRSKLFWAAIAACLAFQAWNIAASHIPTLPQLRTKWVFEQHVAQRHPWDKIPIPVVQVSPLYLGLIYLIPLDLTFSLFFFDILWDVEYILAGLLGWNTTGIEDFPYGLQQSIGGFLALVALVIYLDRRYFVEVARRCLGMRSALADERREGMSYRGAMLGGVLGVGYLWWFLGGTGMTNLVIGLLLVLYFAMVFGLCRVRAQLGPPNHALEGMMPSYLLDTVIGSRMLGPVNAAMLWLLGPFLQGQHTNPAPVQLEALKMAEGGRMDRRRLVVAMAVTVPLTLVCYFWANLHYGYSIGISAGTPNEELAMVSRNAIANMDSRIRLPTDTNVPGTIAIGGGFIFTIALMHLKLRFPWWPIHPAAFPLTLNYVMEEQAVTLLIVWLVKVVLLRYGGLRAHRTAQPLFIGLIVGTSLGTMLRFLPSRLFGVWW